MSQLLSGKHALVTGGARGIGAAITRAFLAQGARVTMFGRSSAPPADATLDPAKIPELHYVAADVSDADAVTQAFATSRSRFGNIEILVNNAGQASSAPFLKTDIGLWRRMISINLDGTFHCSQAVLPDMLAARWGRVVNIASVAGLAGYAYVSAYCWPGSWPPRGSASTRFARATPNPTWSKRVSPTSSRRRPAPRTRRSRNWFRAIRRSA